MHQATPQKLPSTNRLCLSLIHLQQFMLLFNYLSQSRPQVSATRDSYSEELKVLDTMYFNNSDTCHHGNIKTINQ